jgi:hypothetical protein
MMAIIPILQNLIMQGNDRRATFSVRDSILPVFQVAVFTYHSGLEIDNAVEKACIEIQHLRSTGENA